MITFYPGPSKVYPQIAKYMQSAFEEGILSINHRSPECMDITQSAIQLLHERLNIPHQYSVYFISSATEAWEIIAQSLTKEKSTHLYNGAFGEKWAEYAGKLLKQTENIVFGIEEIASPAMLPQLEIEVLCLTQNETSNATQIKDLSVFRKAFPESIIAVDATSSLGGISLNWEDGDVWFASVQKCLGLPAGMAVMICSPKAIERATEINDRKYYNSLLFIHENFIKFQTHYTPNVLNMYLLNKILYEIPNISTISKKIKKQSKSWYEFLNTSEKFGLNCLVQNIETQSDTVIAVQGSEETIQAVKERTKLAGITLGNGYGKWKNSTFRIANFPAIEEFEITKLKEILG